MTSTELMNVQAFENKAPSAAFAAALNPQADSLADGIGSSYGIVGYRGKVWSLRYRGETKQFVRADDGSPAAFLDVIVLRGAPYKSKSYYPAGSFDNDSAGARPTCAALDGVTPDDDVTDKQAQACAICQRNEWKTIDGGRKGKECSDYKRLAVLILPSQTKPLLGEALMEPVFLRVPAASLNDLALLGEAMQKKGFHYSSYVTRIGFQTDKAHPQMTFRALQALTDAEAPMVLPLREDPMALRITGENEVGKPKAAVQQLNGGGKNADTSVTTGILTSKVVEHAEPKQSAPQTTTTSPSEDDEEAALMRKLQEARAKKAAAAAAKVEVIPPKQVAESVDTGFGDVGAIRQPMVEVQANTVGANTTTNTEADTGASEESDTDLDARVANLLK